MMLLLLLAAQTLSHPDLPPFGAASALADAGACRARLAGIVADARGHEAARGPYEIAPGDVRAHIVAAAGGGHRIEEHRCLGAALSSRSWERHMGGGDGPTPIETLLRAATWLAPPAE